jgi:hypothetical protein
MSLALVHLVWGPLGAEPLRRFLDSYRTLDPGAAHDLVFLLNGVDPSSGPGGEALRALEESGVDHHRVVLDRPVLDLAAYMQAAERLEHQQLCFVNSYSVALCDGWLARLHRALSSPGIGVAGATASWASNLSMCLYQMGFRTPYSEAFASRAETWDQFAALLAEQDPDWKPRGVWLTRFWHVLNLRYALRFPAFPAYHLRTNAFAIDRELLRSLSVRPIRVKTDTYHVESGRGSLTAQIENSGLKAVVCGRDDRVYAKEEWAASRTLWQGRQENLLVADNQTRSYERGDLRRREVLSRFAWGPQADPSPPDPPAAAEPLLGPANQPTSRS